MKYIARELSKAKLAWAFLFAFCGFSASVAARDIGSRGDRALAVHTLSAEARQQVGGNQGMQLKLTFSMLSHSGVSGGEDCDDEGDLTLNPVMQSLPSRQAVEPVMLASMSLRSGEDAKRRETDSASLIVKAVASASDANDTQAIPGTSRMLHSWEFGMTDKTLNAGLARWAAAAGWQLVWELPVDYAIVARTTVRGTFEEAVSVVAASMGSAEIPLKAIFYEGNRVLRIVPKGGE